MDESLIKEGLIKYFKFRQFKSDLQKKAVVEVCQRENDVLISMPTGSGKSLCYQLPAVLHKDKITIIFSPLLALIKDQIDHLIALKIRAASLNSKISQTDREALIADLKSTSPNTRILYVTPEQAATSTFKALFQNLHTFDKVAYLVVDEAHCISEWGHDFRPHYQRLGELREKVNVPCIALTATANAEVTKDIIKSLRLANGFKTFKTSCFRDNLFYDVYFPNMLEDPFKHLRDFIRECLNFKAEEDLSKDKKSCGIIYCRTREQTEGLMERLNKLGIKTLCYHAGLKSHERKVFQDKWQNGDVPVICATISFGMGIDKATVRFVVHWGSPKEPASFYQESGRAGRDGKPSRCRVYYNRADSKAIQFHLNQDLGKAGNGENKKKRMEDAIKGFKRVIEFCENPTECRHRLFSNHFGEPPPNCINRCDFCQDKEKVQKMVEQFILKAIQFNMTPATVSHTDYADLYERGRLGILEEHSKYVHSDEEDGSFEREQAKMAANDFIQKQFALRRNPREVSQETVDKLFSKHARVKAAASTSNKVKGLTLSTREQYVSKLLDEFYVNYSECQEAPTLDRKDIEDCSVDVEYEIFSLNTTMTMYRNCIAKLISNIKKCTADQIVHEKLLIFEPKPAKYEILSDLFRNITKKQQLENIEKIEIIDQKVVCVLPEFKTARQALEENKVGRSQSLIGDFFKKGNSNGANKSELQQQEQGKSKDSQDNEVDTFDMAGKTLGRKDLKSLFGDDDSEEENIQTMDSSKHFSRGTSLPTPERELSEALESAVEKHKRRHHKDDRHTHRIREESDRKRRKSSDREDAKKRKKDEIEAKVSKNAEESLESSESTYLRSKYDEFRMNDSVENEHSILELETTCITNIENNNKKEETDDNRDKSPLLKLNKQNGEGSKRQILNKTEVAALVVKLLTPAYAEKRFESRDLFKSLARRISHTMVDKDENEVKEYVKNFLGKNEEITSQTTL